MPKHVARNRYLAINGTAIQDHCNSIEVNDEAERVELTAFTPGGYKEYGVGFKDGNVTAKIFADFDASSVHAMLQPLYQTSGTFSVEVREDASAGVSATNPKMTMTARLLAYAPISGNLGDAAMFDATFTNAGTAGLVWGTS